MARPRANNHDQQRQTIRDQAAREFARLGYASASMSDLAKACSVSKAALYHYFDSKEAILFEALDQYVCRLQTLTTSFHVAANESSADSAETARNQLAALIKGLLAEYAHSHNYHVCLLNDVKFLGPIQRDRITSMQRDVVKTISQQIDRAFPGRIDPSVRSATTMALLGMVNFTFAWWNPDGDLDEQQLAELMIDLWWRGLDSGLDSGQDRRRHDLSALAGRSASA